MFAERAVTLTWLGVLLAGCSLLPADLGDTPRSDKSAPVFHVYAGDAVLTLEAWTFCVPGMCADGSPPASPPTVASPTAVLIEIPRPDWALEATVRDLDDCSERPGRLSPEGASRLRLEPTASSGSFDVNLFAHKDAEGDASATFRWNLTPPGQTPSASPNAPCR